ncbi:MAG: hypothetical protein II937_00675 [Bacteroidales bacterium]|nr:hypothetical protein [Bacteroidales bacterium]
MGKQLTKEELIATLQHSKLPTILVEGKTDCKIYRWIEEDINDSLEIDIDILPCSCRSVLLEVFLSCSRVKDLLFIADKDTYAYTRNIPAMYSGVIFTTGYSIENDLIQGKKFIENWLNRSDKKIFAKCLTEYIEYYATALEEWKHNISNSFEIKSPYQVLDEKNDLKEEYKSKISPSQDVIDYLVKDYDLLIQGHALFNLITKVICRKDRTSKPNLDAIYEICYKNYESDCIKLLKDRIKQRLHL